MLAEVGYDPIHGPHSPPKQVRLDRKSLFYTPYCRSLSRGVCPKTRRHIED